MGEPSQPVRLGNVFFPNADWLARHQPEAILEPDLPILDPHHHLWERADHRYLLPDLLADLASGHNVVGTVFVECMAMYRAHGPSELRPVGETEFVNGVAAMSASGGYGPARICAGIVGFADLTLRDRVEPVLEAHVAAGGGRFRGEDGALRPNGEASVPTHPLTGDREFNAWRALLMFLLRSNRRMIWERRCSRPRLREAQKLSTPSRAQRNRKVSGRHRGPSRCREGRLG